MLVVVCCAMACDAVVVDCCCLLLRVACVFVERCSLLAVRCLVCFCCWCLLTGFASCALVVFGRALVVGGCVLLVAVMFGVCSLLAFCWLLRVCCFMSGVRFSLISIGG